MRLYAEADRVTDIQAISISENHDSSIATAIITANNHTAGLGDLVSIAVGYSDLGFSTRFTGYVKQIEKTIPDNTWTITLHDTLIRAQDYFIAAPPNSIFKRQNIKAEDLVRELLALAGLTSYSYQATEFTFGTVNAFEVNLVNVLDYIRTICDLLTWSVWADMNGTIHFKNRKPYPMTGDSGQFGDIADVSAYTVTKEEVLNLQYTLTEKSLRNRVAVYGVNDIYAEAQASSPYLPAGFYKTAVLAAQDLINSQSLAQKIADYNLDLLNRASESLSLSVIGNSNLRARTVITFPSDFNAQYGVALNGNWYVFGCDHSWGQPGYITNLELRRTT